MKTKNLKKILSISIISLVLALTAVVIILAIVPKKHYNPVDKDFYSISVWRETVTNNYLVKDGEVGSDESNGIVNDIVALHERSLKDNVLSSLFQGTSSFKPVVRAYGYNNVKTEFQKDGYISIVFNYATEQKLIFQGEEYKHSSSQQSQKTVTFERAVLVLTNSSSFEKATLYLTDADFSSDYQVEFLAHQAELYEYIIGLDIPMNKA